MTTMIKKKVLKKDFDIELAVIISSTDNVTGDITSLTCKFCTHFGREESHSTTKKGRDQRSFSHGEISG